MSDKEFIEFLWNLLQDAIADPDFFYVSKKDMETISEELLKRNIKLSKWGES